MVPTPRQSDEDVAPTEPDRPDKSGEADLDPGLAPGREDVESDPAHDDEDGSDWSTEGGATPEGPATATDSRESG